MTFEKQAAVETERLNDVPEKELTFENILDKIASRGRFQVRLNLVHICLSAILCTMSRSMYTLSIIIPDHWCSVPGRTENISIETWKNITIPREGDGYSKCQMFQDTSERNKTVSCVKGWEFDKTWFSRTLPSQENWVCGDEIILSNTLATIQGLSVVVGLAICYVGDRFGRRIQYFLSLAVVTVCRSLSVPASNIYPLFLMLSVLACAADGSITEASLAVGLELTDIMYRSTITIQYALMMSVASVLSPLIAWATADWATFMLIGSIPCFLLFFCQGFFPESPRWLLNKGHTKKAFSVIREIAETNSRPLPEDTYEVLSAMSKRRSANMGVLSLVTNKSLFKNTLLLVFGRSVCTLTTFSLMLNIGNLGGNPFLAFMAQGAADLPANLAAHFLGNKFGRRFTEALSFVAATMVSVFIIVVLTVSGSNWMVTTAVAILKFFCVMSLFTNILQSMEIHPTCIRQIGSAIEWAFVGAIIGIAPYIVLLGTKIDPRLFYAVLGVCLALAAVITSFLPESLHERLPETLEDASNYGATQKYWSLPVAKKR